MDMVSVFKERVAGAQHYDSVVEWESGTVSVICVDDYPMWEILDSGEYRAFDLEDIEYEQTFHPLTEGAIDEVVSTLERRCENRQVIKSLRKAVEDVTGGDEFLWEENGWTYPAVMSDGVVWEISPHDLSTRRIDTNAGVDTDEGVLSESVIEKIIAELV